MLISNEISYSLLLFFLMKVQIFQKAELFFRWFPDNLIFLWFDRKTLGSIFGLNFQSKCVCLIDNIREEHAWNSFGQRLFWNIFWPNIDQTMTMCKARSTVWLRQQRRCGDVRPTFSFGLYWANGDGHFDTVSWSWRAENIRLLCRDVPCIAISTQIQTGATCPTAPCAQSARRQERTGAKFICLCAYRDT